MDQSLINLAEKVLVQYDIYPTGINLIKEESAKVVWKIETSSTSLCLKRLGMSLNSALFSIYAQVYLAQNGAKVPAIYKSKDGKSYVFYENCVYVLYDWLPGHNLRLDNLDELELGIYEVARFHLMSQGYVPPKDSRIPTKLGKWPEYYVSVLERWNKWKQIANHSPKNALTEVFLSNVDANIRLGQKALEILQQSYYKQWVADNELKKTLCHQDFWDGNALIAPEAVYIIDLDMVTYDIPVRDLRKIVNRRIRACGRWGVELLQKTCSWYCKVNPLNREQLKVLYIDLLFPHLFNYSAIDIFQENAKLSAKTLSEVVCLENDK